MSEPEDLHLRRSRWHDLGFKQLHHRRGQSATYCAIPRQRFQPHSDPMNLGSHVSRSGYLLARQDSNLHNMVQLISFDHLRWALDLADFNSCEARQRMSPVPRGWQRRANTPKRAAVMILVFPDHDARLNLVLTLRRAELRGHSGQVSFPGGRQDPQDASLAATAIRETCEEIGVCDDQIRIVGSLPSFYIPTSHFQVFPTVAQCDAVPLFRANPAEVESIFSFALSDLLHPRFKREETWRFGERDVWVPYYAVKGHKVWGATAIMLSELEERIRQVLPQDVLLELR